MAEAQPNPAWDAHVHVFEAGAATGAGHYVLAAGTFPELEAVSLGAGIDRMVLVQPSVYGTDNDILLRALEVHPGMHRGVVVIDDTITDAQLDAMHEAGVRGVRFNLVSPVGNGDDGFAPLAPRLRERGWHAQWYAQADQLAHLVAMQAQSQLTFVLDHLAGMTASSGEAQWNALGELAAQGAWIKLSGWYRLGFEAPYTDAAPLIQRAAKSFGDRTVWGSDWPHTSLPAAASRHASLLAPVRAALGEEATHSILTHHPERLYIP